MKLFICPICKHPLIGGSQQFTCENNHSFDKAKEGYVNLLPVQHKHSKQPGDSLEQLKARRRFLTAGYFEPLVEQLNSLICGETVLDIGSGEGYFSKAFAQHSSNLQVYGIDIAKEGVKMSAKGAPVNASFAVASSYEIPLANKGFDSVVRVYAPSKPSEVLRLLKDDGLFLVVAPGQDHLIGLRRSIYDVVKLHQDNSKFEGFSLDRQITLSGEMEFSSQEDVEALLLMTPFSWKLTPEKRAELMQSLVKDSYDFSIQILRKVCE